MRRSICVVGRICLTAVLVTGLGVFGACAPAGNTLSVLDRPRQDFDDPPLEMAKKGGVPLPDEWRWFGNVPDGHLYLGVNRDDVVCTIASYAGRHAFFNCGAPVSYLPQFAFFYADENHAPISYIVVQDGYDYLTTDDGLYCLINNNLVVIVNPTGQEQMMIHSYDGQKSMDVAAPAATALTVPLGERYCA